MTGNTLLGGKGKAVKNIAARESSLKERNLSSRTRNGLLVCRVVKPMKKERD